jgi:hypothetical protein
MSFKQVGLGLGYFSLALGALEVLAPGRIARALGVKEDSAKGLIRAFGVRELAAGAMLLKGPAVSTNVWNRVFGDAMDAAALASAYKGSTRKDGLTGALAFVGAAAVLDLVTAIGLDNETGRTFPKLQTSAA